MSGPPSRVSWVAADCLTLHDLRQPSLHASVMGRRLVSESGNAPNLKKLPQTFPNVRLETCSAIGDQERVRDTQAAERLLQLFPLSSWRLHLELPSKKLYSLDFHLEQGLGLELVVLGAAADMADEGKSCRGGQAGVDCEALSL